MSRDTGISEKVLGLVPDDHAVLALFVQALLHIVMLTHLGVCTSTNCLWLLHPHSYIIQPQHPTHLGTAQPQTSCYRTVLRGCGERLNYVHNIVCSNSDKVVSQMCIVEWVWCVFQCLEESPVVFTGLSCMLMLPISCTVQYYTVAYYHYVTTSPPI